MAKIFKIDIVMACLMMLFLLIFSKMFDLPIVLPSSESASMVGIHYLLPLILAFVLGIVACCRGSTTEKRAIIVQTMISVLCYAVILYAHFSFKLWIPFINKANYDPIYWDGDQHLHGIVEACKFLRGAFLPIIPYASNFYMIAYVSMFYIAIIYQAKKDPEKLRELFVACMVMQILGTVGYLLLPAIGPFVYEHGTDPLIDTQQHSMLAFYRHSVAHGPHWLALHGADGFTAGLAAMPSLHVAGAALFFFFALRNMQVLTPLFFLLLAFITIAAVANRWHYLIDIPAGFSVALISLALAPRLLKLEQIWQNAEAKRVPVTTFA